MRLWMFGFNTLLEALRRASFTSPLALEHLQDYIYYAYTFYTGLLDEPQLDTYSAGWLEALGDVARYRWAVATMVASSYGSGTALTHDALDALRQAESAQNPVGSLAPPVAAGNSVSDGPAAARIDDSPSPSVGIAAARQMAIEPEQERWRCIAIGWYSAGLVDQPGTGRLHYRLGTLSRDTDSEALRSLYHFVKRYASVLYIFPCSLTHASA